MTTNGPSGATPLVLKELDIPGRTGPVSEAPTVWGLNIAAVKDNFPQQGLLCRAGPWGAMNVGDKLVIFKSRQQVAQETVDANEVGTTLSMFIAPARFSNGRSDLSYAVTRLGQVAEPSEVMEVLVKLDRPGGHDGNDEPGHSQLIMTIPKEILEGGIDKDNVAAGVPITIGPSADGSQPYPNAAAGDVIQVSWGGVFVVSDPLTQDQADGKAPIILHVSEEDIREAGDSDDAGLAVAFEVYDLVDNRSEDWSKEQRVVVAVDAERLGAPLLKQAVNNVLDVDKLGDADGTAQILAVDTSKFQVGDIPFVRVKGTPVEGPPIDSEFPGAALTSVPSIPEIKIPNAALRQLAKAQIAFSVRLQKADNSADLRSKTQFISAIGEVKRLAAPIALDALQGAIDPELAQARIQIPFDTIFVAGQAIKLFWLGTRPDLSTYLPDLALRPITQGEIDAALPLMINVAGVHLKSIEGGTLELYYHLLNDDKVLGTMNRVNATHAIRESIHADTLRVGEAKAELPEPKVQGVVNGVLPPDTVGTTLTVEYLNTVKDDEVFRLWEGSKTGPDEDSVKLSSFTAGQEVPFTIKAELIKGNEGGTVEASYSIVWADGRPTSYSDVLEFRVGVELELTAPRIKEAPNDTTLVPNAAKDALTALVNYPEIALLDEIIATFTGAPGTPAAGSYTAPPKIVQNLGEQEIPLDNGVVAFNLDKDVALSYTVKRGNNAPLPSQIRPLAVQSLILDLSNVPKILQAANNGDGQELDLNAISTSATIHAPIWPLIALRQYVWLRIRGTLANGTAYEKLLWQPPTSITSQAWLTTGKYEYAIPPATLNELKELKHATPFTLEFKAALGGSQNEPEAVTFPLRTYTINAVEDVKPVITRIADSKDVEILPGGITVDTTVNLTGTASKGQKVEILDGRTSEGEADVHPTTGVWTKDVMGLSLALHTFTAKAKYGSEQTSDPRTLTVTAATAPTITSAKGLPSNVEIPNTGFTVETSVTLIGVAAKGQKVDVLDGQTSKDQPTADLVTGIWTLVVASLTAALHSFTAKALYLPGAVSVPRTLTVTPATTPTIASVKGANGVDIPNGNSTVDTTLTLSGTASDGHQVEIFDGIVSKGTAPAIGGIWTKQITGLEVGAYSFTAKGLYGSNPVSTPARTITVVIGRPIVMTRCYDGIKMRTLQEGDLASGHFQWSGTCSPGPARTGMVTLAYPDGQPGNSRWIITIPEGATTWSLESFHLSALRRQSYTFEDYGFPGVTSPFTVRVVGP
ncbi:hypothetical protein [Pseudomonas sp. LB3P14]